MFFIDFWISSAYIVLFLGTLSIYSVALVPSIIQCMCTWSNLYLWCTYCIPTCMSSSRLIFIRMVSTQKWLTSNAAVKQFLPRRPCTFVSSDCPSPEPPGGSGAVSFVTQFNGTHRFKMEVCRRKRSALSRLLLVVSLVCFAYPAVLHRISSNKKIDSSSSEAFSSTRLKRSVYLNFSNSILAGHDTETQKVNCVKPSIDDFPDDFMTQYQRQKRGGVIFHILVALYMFAALAIVCDDYFVSSLEKISDGLHIKSDVAGATFMAAGSSAPELFTSVFGVFITKGDIGLGTIVGSAVFNLLFIVAVCGIFAGCVLELTRWPLLRDSLCYLFTIIALIVITHDKKVYWYEALVLVGMYILYVIIMYFNETLARFFGVKDDLRPFSPGEEEGKSLISDENKGDLYSDEDSEEPQQPKEVDVVDFDSNGPSPLTVPSGGMAVVRWLLALPLSCLLYATIPDCRTERWKRWYFLTFIMSVVWIAAFSYVLVWMVCIIGFTLEIPDVIMGLTFLAAGSSVPDGISSLLVARQGDGDMAVSNTIGSNVFDILLCLGLPWLLQTTVVDYGGHVNVISGSIIYTSISLLGTVVVTIFLIALKNWKLDRCVGCVFMFLYLSFISVATLFELNVFGDYNLPVCSK